MASLPFDTQDLQSLSQSDLVFICQELCLSFDKKDSKKVLLATIRQFAGQQQQQQMGLKQEEEPSAPAVVEAMDSGLNTKVKLEALEAAIEETDGREVDVDAGTTEVLQSASPAVQSEPLLATSVASKVEPCGTPKASVADAEEENMELDKSLAPMVAVMEEPSAAVTMSVVEDPQAAIEETDGQEDDVDAGITEDLQAASPAAQSEPLLATSVASKVESCGTPKALVADAEEEDMELDESLAPMVAVSEEPSAAVTMSVVEDPQASASKAADMEVAQEALQVVSLTPGVPTILYPASPAALGADRCAPGTPDRSEMHPAGTPVGRCTVSSVGRRSVGRRELRGLYSSTVMQAHCGSPTRGLRKLVAGLRASRQDLLGTTSVTHVGPLPLTMGDCVPSVQAARPSLYQAMGMANTSNGQRRGMVEPPEVRRARERASKARVDMAAAAEAARAAATKLAAEAAAAPKRRRMSSKISPPIFYAEKAAKDAAARQRAVVPTIARDFLADRSERELRSSCKELALSPHGSKQELITRLLAHYVGRAEAEEPEAMQSTESSYHPPAAAAASSSSSLTTMLVATPVTPAADTLWEKLSPSRAKAWRSGALVAEAATGPAELQTEPSQQQRGREPCSSRGGRPRGGRQPLRAPPRCLVKQEEVTSSLKPRQSVVYDDDAPSPSASAAAAAAAAEVKAEEVSCLQLVAYSPPAQKVEAVPVDAEEGGRGQKRGRGSSKTVKPKREVVVKEEAREESEAEPPAEPSRQKRQRVRQADFYVKEKGKWLSERQQLKLAMQRSIVEGAQLVEEKVAADDCETAAVRGRRRSMAGG